MKIDSLKRICIRKICKSLQIFSIIFFNPMSHVMGMPVGTL